MTGRRSATHCEGVMLLTETTQSRAIMRVLDGEAIWPPPIWVNAPGRTLPAGIPRQARGGRRLPRHVLQSGFCRRGNPSADPALRLRCRNHVFPTSSSCPHALGQNLWFAEGEGPRLDPVTTREDLAKLRQRDPAEHLAPVFRDAAPPAPGIASRDNAARFLRSTLDRWRVT